MALRVSQHSRGYFIFTWCRILYFYIVALHNHSNIPQMITHGDRIAQMAVVPFWQADFEEVFELDETERGAGGFGSTGKQ